jgi:hypothetical protein
MCGLTIDEKIECSTSLRAAALCGLGGLPFTDVIPFALILLVTSVPVALPATFTSQPRSVLLNWAQWCAGHEALCDRRSSRHRRALH